MASTTRRKPHPAATAHQARKHQPGKTVALSAADRHRRIAEAAYYRSLGRDPDAFDPLDDWLSAERELCLLVEAPEAGISIEAAFDPAHEV